MSESRHHTWRKLIAVDTIENLSNKLAKEKITIEFELSQISPT